MTKLKLHFLSRPRSAFGQSLELDFRVILPTHFVWLQAWVGQSYMLSFIIRKSPQRKNMPNIKAEQTSNCNMLHKKQGHMALIMMTIYTLHMKMHAHVKMHAHPNPMSVKERQMLLSSASSFVQQKPKQLQFWKTGAQVTTTGIDQFPVVVELMVPTFNLSIATGSHKSTYVTDYCRKHGGKSNHHE